MGKLSSYRIPKRNVILGDENAISVRGLALNDIMMAFEAHKFDMEAVFESLMSEDRAALPQAELLLAVIKQAPSLTAMLIAVACDEPEQTEVVLTMPLGDQISLGEAVLALTLKDTLVLKKLMEMAEKAGKTPTLPKMRR